jgi:hypothetical protein
MKQISITAARETIIKSLDAVDTCFPSIYTKDDVKLLLHSLLDNLEGQATEQVITQETNVLHLLNTFAEKVRDKFERKVQSIDFANYVDTHSAEFSLDGNEIELDSVDLRCDDLEEQIREEYDEAVEAILSEYEEKENTVEAN